MLPRFEEFKHSQIVVLITDVVENELYKHLLQDVADTQKKAEASIKANYADGTIVRHRHS